MLPRLCFVHACKAYCSSAGIMSKASAAVMLQQRLTHSRSVPVLSGLWRTGLNGDVPCSSQTAVSKPARLYGSPNSTAQSGQQAAGQQTSNSNSANYACDPGCSGHNSSIVSSSWGYNSSSGSRFYWNGLEQRRMLSTGAGDTSRGASTHSKPAAAPPGSKINSPGSSSSNSSSSSDGNGSRTSSSSSSSSSEEAKVQVPPAAAAGAAAAGEAVSRAAKAAAKQASRLVKLVQATSLSEATWLQLSSMWQSHSAAITAATAAAATAGVYQVFAAAAGQLVDMSDPSAYWSCLAASAAAVGLVGQQVRSSFAVDADRVYRISMRKLNRHAGLKEVMGSPLAGSDVRLELVTQGTLFVQETLLPRRRAPRIHLMFQLTGPTKSGVVSVTAKKAFGSKYAFKTLMVELPDKTLTSQAAGAAAVTALSQSQAARSQASVWSPGQSDQQRSAQDSSSSAQGASSSSSSSSSSGSTPDPSTASSTGTDPARIYLIGSPAGSSCSSSTRHMSPGVLLEDLKEPLLYALKHNLPGYEAEDEFEGQLAWSKPHQDADQLTWWDDAKVAFKRIACRAYTAARTAGAAAATAASKAGTALKAKAAAGPTSRSSTAAAGSTAGSSSSGPGSSGIGAGSSTGGGSSSIGSSSQGGSSASRSSSLGNVGPSTTPDTSSKLPGAGGNLQ